MRHITPVILFILLAAVGCSDGPPDHPTGGRDLGSTVIAEGLEFQLSPGAIDTTTDSSIEARASAPLPSFQLETGPEGVDDVTISLTNIHRDATVRPRRIRSLSARDAAGCPDPADHAPIICPRPDDSTGQAPVPEGCESPTIAPTPDRQSRLDISITQHRCRRVTYQLDFRADRRDQPLTLAVLGATDSIDELTAAVDQATRDEPDAVVLLGDNAEHASVNGLRRLQTVLHRSDFPAIVLAGDDEIVEGSRGPFLETFGPLSLQIEMAGVQLVTVDSADGHLAAGGVDRLDEVLHRLDGRRPILVFTHTAPVDPVGPRNQGFDSQLQGARTLSVITDAGANALFTGHIHDTDHRSIRGVQSYLTSVDDADQYLWVLVDNGRVVVEARRLRGPH